MNWREKFVETIESISGLTAYPSHGVPEDVTFPWITYELSRGDFAEETSIVLHTHHYTESENVPNMCADMIVRSMHEGGLNLLSDDGRMILHTGSPEWFATADETDRMHKHRIINLNILWLLR